ncbi:MAG: hypothetical protein ACK5OX_07900 [Desertimonas sp.]
MVLVLVAAAIFVSPALYVLAPEAMRRAGDQLTHVRVAQASDARNRRLLLAGAVAGIVILATATAETVTRPTDASSRSTPTVVAAVAVGVTVVAAIGLAGFALVHAGKMRWLPIPAVLTPPSLHEAGEQHPWPPPSALPSHRSE